MPTVRFLVLTLLVILPFTASLAQSDLPGERLREVNGEVHADMNPTEMIPADSNPDGMNATTGMALAVAAVPPASLRDKAALHSLKVPVIDKRFIAAMAGLGGAESLRFTTHQLVLDHEFAAGAPWVTSVPASQHLVAKYGGIYAAELLVAYELKKPHSWLPGDKAIRKLWWAYPAAMTPIHIKNGIRSIRTQARQDARWPSVNYSHNSLRRRCEGAAIEITGHVQEAN